ncbi:interleukin-1 beta-like [Pelobates fuscus]|uniref:interleukin-1 beta-like n=1 Tax=Pelobates fuscus TaxID=191477 RepID=UPI002FE440A0
MTMAQVPDMESDLMDNNSDYEESFYDNVYCDTKKSFHDSHCFSGPSSCSGYTPEKDSVFSFRKAVVLVVAIDKLRKRINCHRDFKDTDLLNLFNTIFVQEDIPFETSSSTFASNDQYKYAISKECCIRDSYNKSMALLQSSGKARLVAIYLQELNSEREEKIIMNVYVKQSVSGINKRPVTLGLVGRNLYLSCSSVEGEPKLYLEKVSDIKEVKQDELQRFIFLKSENDATCTFESAACPGWYISTSQAENELVQMKPEADQRYIREFLVLS